MSDSMRSAYSGAAAQGAPTVHYNKELLGRARELMGRLSGARRAARFYPDGHPAYDEAIGQLFAAIRPYLAKGVPVQVGFVDGEILLGDQLLTEESVAHAQFTNEVSALGIGSISFGIGVMPDELARATRVLAFDERALEAAGGLPAVLAEARLTHVAIGAMRRVQRSEADRFTLPASARAAYRSSTALIHEFDGADQREVTLDPSRIDNAVRSLVDNVLNNRDAMVQLAGVREHDEYTYQHSSNVAALALSLGSLISTEPEFLSSLGTGALLHDVGKLAVGKEIINKQGALDPGEWEKMRRHPVAGAEMIASMSGVDPGAVVAIAEHHVRYDGGGYPQRSTTRRPHIVSRIVSVADCYDAMTSRRSYSAARLPDEAMALLVKNAGSALDPALVRLFVMLMGVYPPRSIVRLSGGEVAIVMRSNPEEIYRPLVRIVAGPTGELIQPTDIDLAEQRELSVKSCLDPNNVNIDIEAFVT